MRHASLRHVRSGLAAGAFVLLGGCIVASTASATAGVDAVDEVHASFGNNAQTSMWVGWHGDAATVRYGRTISYGLTATAVPNPYVPADIAGPFEHVLLTGLTAGTIYHYQIDGGADHQFMTAPSGDFTWDDIGDTSSTYNSYDAGTGTGCNSSWMGAVWQQVADELPDFVTHGGDISYANQCGAGAVHQYFNDIAPIATLRAYEQSWGNHEYGSPTSTAPPGTPRDSMADYKGRLYLANPQPASNDTASQVTNPGCPSPSNPSVNGCQGNDWGYYTIGHVLIIEYPETWYTAQTDWGPRADALMAAAEADPNISFIVTTGHRPAYSASTSQLDAPLKTVLDGLGDKYSPQARPDGKYLLNIAHHVHGGEVFAPQHGVVHITNGGGGTEAITFARAAAGSVFHLGHFEHLRITVTGASMRVDMICGPPWAGHTTADNCALGSTVYSTTLTSPVAPPGPPPAVRQWVTNPGLDGGNATGWTGIYNGASRVGVVQDAGGNWLIRVATTSATAAPAGVNNPSPYWVNNATAAGTVYTATAQAMPSVSGVQAYVLIRETSPTGAGISYAQTAKVTLTASGSLTQLPSVSYRAVNSGDSLRLSVIAANLSGGQLLYVDNVSLTSPG